eukprot:2713348-Amphidinium_carterae.1
MLFNYTSGEEHGYQVVHFWFKKKRMVTSISYKNENDPVNGAQVGRINEIRLRAEAEAAAARP